MFFFLDNICDANIIVLNGLTVVHFKNNLKMCGKTIILSKKLFLYCSPNLLYAV